VTRQEWQRQFVEWAQDYDGLLWKVARSFATGADQDDLHQELLLALWKAIPFFRGDSKSVTFVYRVVHNHALCLTRKSSRCEVPLDSAPQPHANSEEDRRAADARVDELYRHIRLLAPLDRTLILLYLDELSYREMAEILGITESNVGVRLNRVKKQLAGQMTEVARV
jgi:RNA polymerase sigma-70 factor (ECF subfamily)